MTTPLHRQHIHIDRVLRPDAALPAALDAWRTAQA